MLAAAALAAAPYHPAGDKDGRAPCVASQVLPQLMFQAEARVESTPSRSPCSLGQGA
jgi:hypothetical protein